MSNIYDASRDPRLLNRRVSNAANTFARTKVIETTVEDTKVVQATRAKTKVSETRDTAPRIVTAYKKSNSNREQASGAPQNDHRKSIQHLQDRTKDLLARIASREADNASLQKKKAATAAMFRDAHNNLTTATTALTTLTVSYEKRLKEKNRVISYNADLELTNSELRNTIAAQLRTISENETEIRDLQKENCDLMDRLGVLEREIGALKPRVEQLTAEDRTRMRQPYGQPHGGQSHGGQPSHWRAARSTYTERGGGYRSPYENTREREGLARAREEDRGSLRTRSRVGGYDRDNANRPPRSASPREGGDGGN